MNLSKINPFGVGNLPIEAARQVQASWPGTLIVDQSASAGQSSKSESVWNAAITLSKIFDINYPYKELVTYNIDSYNYL
ncbi:hypothetical protein JCM15831A_16450 [Asaia astilbis]